MLGLQFHPESIETKVGRTIIGNFFKIVEDWWIGKERDLTIVELKSVMPRALVEKKKPRGEWGITAVRVDECVDSLKVFEDIVQGGTNMPACWLDSSRTGKSARGGRFSFMGNMEGPNRY
jgi:hypothetical protein